MDLKTREFYSYRCGLRFVKPNSCLVERCLNCQEPCIDVGYIWHMDWNRSDFIVKRLLESRLDDYSRQKLMWYSNQGEYEKSIIKRKTITEYGKDKVVEQSGLERRAIISPT